MTYFLNILFPPRCYGCRRKDITLCSSCLQKCAKSIDTPAIYITSLYSFKDPLIKRVIHAIKYYYRQDLIEPLVKELAKELQPDDSCTLIPIPMTRIRKYIRGYNQAEIIAKKISQHCSIPYDTTILARSRSTKRQVKAFTRNERLKNQNNSFVITSDVTNMNIILVDDVTTTGATIAETRKVLLKAGAKTVRAITLAH